MAFLWLLSAVCIPAAYANVTVTIAVAAEQGALLSEQDGTLLARVRWLGSQHESDMSIGSDGIWRAEFSGKQARALGVEIWRTDAQPHRRISQTLEMVSVGDATIAYAISKGGDDAAWRLSRPMSIADMRNHYQKNVYTLQHV